MESDQLFDCTVKRRKLMGQTVYKSDVGYRSILLYMFQLKNKYKYAVVMSNRGRGRCHLTIYIIFCSYI